MNSRQHYYQRVHANAASDVSSLIQRVIMTTWSPPPSKRQQNILLPMKKMMARLSLLCFLLLCLEELVRVGVFPKVATRAIFLHVCSVCSTPRISLLGVNIGSVVVHPNCACYGVDEVRGTFQGSDRFLMRPLPTEACKTTTLTDLIEQYMCAQPVQTESKEDMCGQCSTLASVWHTHHISNMERLGCLAIF